MKKIFFISFALIFFVFSVSLKLRNARGDIYMRMDRNGVVHFSNAPVSTNYRFFMKTERSNPVPLSGVPYHKIIEKASRKFGVNSKLVAAVIKVESNFNKNAVSGKGAEGLMQIIPGTQNLLDISNPFDPAQNIYGGTKYLGGLISRYKGNLPLALAAYNAGSDAVSEYGGIPPYAETKEYVKKVLYYYKNNKEK